jgi:hypothetical protein
MSRGFFCPSFGPAISSSCHHALEEVLPEDVPLDGASVREKVVPPEVVVVPNDDELVPLVGRLADRSLSAHC